MDGGYTGTGEQGGPLGRHRLLILLLILTSICGDRGCGFIGRDGRREGYPLRDDTLFGLGVSQSEGQFQGQVTREREGGERGEREREGGREVGGRDGGKEKGRRA
jgi:hypothetical protein